MSEEVKKGEVIFPQKGETVYGYKRKKSYKVTRELGKGAFGAVVEVEVIPSEKEKQRITGLAPQPRHAMKCEMIGGRACCLKVELEILREFRNGGRHFCRIYDRAQTPTYRFIIMTLVGHNLHDLKNDACTDGHFTWGTALRVAIQTLEALEDFHSAGYLHRDIKPGNFAIGTNISRTERRKVYLLDFGLARRYKRENGELRRPRIGVGFRGTSLYASSRSHAGEDLGRRDDLVSWLYMMIELTNGTLPWRGVKVDRSEPNWKQSEYNIMWDRKQYCISSVRGMDELLENCPRCYDKILMYVDKKLEFWSIPDYGYIYGLLRRTLEREGVRESAPYDWETGGKFGKQINQLPPPTTFCPAEAAVGSDDHTAIPTEDNKTDIYTPQAPAPKK